MSPEYGLRQMWPTNIALEMLLISFYAHGSHASPAIQGFLAIISSFVFLYVWYFPGCPLVSFIKFILKRKRHQREFNQQDVEEEWKK